MFSGLFLENATSCCRFSAGTEGWTTSSYGEYASMPTPRRSPSLYERFGIISGEITSDPMSDRSTVCSSVAVAAAVQVLVVARLRRRSAA